MESHGRCRLGEIQREKFNVSGEKSPGPAAQRNSTGEQRTRNTVERQNKLQLHLPSVKEAFRGTLRVLVVQRTRESGPGFGRLAVDLEEPPHSVRTSPRQIELCVNLAKSSDFEQFEEESPTRVKVNIWQGQRRPCIQIFPFWSGTTVFGRLLFAVCWGHQVRMETKRTAVPLYFFFPKTPQRFDVVAKEPARPHVHLATSCERVCLTLRPSPCSSLDLLASL